MEKKTHKETVKAVFPRSIPVLTGYMVLGFGFGVAFLCLLVFGQSGFLIPSMIGITFILLAFRKQLEKEEATND